MVRRVCVGRGSACCCGGLLCSCCRSSGRFPCVLPLLVHVLVAVLVVGLTCSEWLLPVIVQLSPFSLLCHTVRNSCCPLADQSTCTLIFKLPTRWCNTGAKQVARLRKTNVQKATVKAAIVFKTLLRQLVYTYKPRKSLTLAFDGIASLSKGKEQSSRRMKDWMSVALIHPCAHTCCAHAASINWATGQQALERHIVPANHVACQPRPHCCQLPLSHVACDHGTFPVVPSIAINLSECPVECCPSPVCIWCCRGNTEWYEDRRTPGARNHPWYCCHGGDGGSSAGLCRVMATGGTVGRSCCVWLQCACAPSHRACSESRVLSLALASFRCLLSAPPVA
jgi:hypothetical protein